MSLKRPSENIFRRPFCIKNQSTRHLTLNSADIRFTGVDGTDQLLDLNLITFLFGRIQLGLKVGNSGLFIAYFGLQYLFAGFFRAWLRSRRNHRCCTDNRGFVFAV